MTEPIPIATETPVARDEPFEGRKPRKGDVLVVEFHGFDPKGRSAGRSGPYSVLARRGLPGETARLEVRKRRGDRVEGDHLETLAPSPHAIEARCAHSGTCGGCSFQDLEYAQQLREKLAGLEKILAGLSTEVRVEDVVPCEDPFGYRNKMDFTFANRRWVESHEAEGVERDRALGLHVKGFHGKVLDIAECHIQFPLGNRILRAARRLSREQQLSLWDIHAHEGLLRHLVLRHGEATDEVLVQLVTSEEAPDQIGPFVEGLLSEVPEITTVVQTLNEGLATVAQGDRHLVLHGPGFIRDRLGEVEFRVSAPSFFQTNSAQARRMVEIVRGEVAGTGTEVLYDLYCGGGTFALTLAGDVREVIGIELSEPAVEDGRRNARENGIENVTFEAGDMADLLRPEALAAAGRPPVDVCLVDPPRAGIHPKVRAGILALAPPRIVWVSCNLSAAIPDLEALLAEGWELRRIVPLDLFPHTPHVECVLTLERPRARMSAGSFRIEAEG